MKVGHIHEQLGIIARFSKDFLVSYPLVSQEVEADDLY